VCECVIPCSVLIISSGIQLLLLHKIKYMDMVSDDSHKRMMSGTFISPLLKRDSEDGDKTRWTKGGERLI
jgi:hypothetical protein